MLYDRQPTRLQRVLPKIGIGAASGAVGLLLGRAFSVPGNTEFWKVAGQPSATVLASAGVIAAGYLAFHMGRTGSAADETACDEVDGDISGDR